MIAFSDNMPVIVPLGNHWNMPVAVPDSTVNYFIRDKRIGSGNFPDQKK
ncbi:hypothetical protein OU798_10270 [Prolixibacteraceae bacterium Z1-6]|uniref:Uncharacterized protein n=1 Tax=Draconibacterium aestuarii TaxID=2998507 RepID=A0A9X3F5M0_9BACT|nr:hypothetical protein [Prolixibacteraceae bacterium Z1-6]